MQDKNYVTRWIVTFAEKEEYTIKKREVSCYMPINRMLDDVGYYPYDFIPFKTHLYYYTFFEKERFTSKSKVMIGRFNRSNGKLIMVDMTHEDGEFMQEIKAKLLKKRS